MGNKKSPKKWPWDLPHRGELLRRIRDTRGLEQEDIAKLSNVSVSTISRVENGTSHEAVSDYIAALASVSSPLTPEEMQVVYDLCKDGQADAIRRREQELSWIRFADPRIRTPLVDLTESLREISSPAFVTDPTLSVHAINGAGLRLFGIDPSDEWWVNRHLRRREFWNYLTCKLYEGSPFHDAHTERTKYYRHALWKLFREPYIRPYWFTYQMRTLVHTMHTLTAHGGFRFSTTWRSITGFDDNDYAQQVNRTLLYRYAGSRMAEIQAEVKEGVNHEIEVGPGIRVTFQLVEWGANGSKAKEAFANMSRSPLCRNVYYASTYDTPHGPQDTRREPSFHINTWPEVSAYLHPEEIEA
jgi:transcriptional regulator with XRE-family HTH domain